ALWATQQLLPYERGGVFAKNLEAGHEAALQLYRYLSSNASFITPSSPPALDIVFWAVKAGTWKDSSTLAQRIFDEAAKRDLHLALANLPVRFFPVGSWPQAKETGYVTCLRSVLMKPEHLAWIGEICQRLEAACSASIAVNTAFDAD
ncbi:MAG TPA: aspartate aminotransferase family protein, partial [Edaphobacter sp.]|nr:aspartate aminotransferase family protein [Edaphobacter sp.]